MQKQIAQKNPAITIFIDKDLIGFLIFSSSYAPAASRISSISLFEKQR